MDQLGNPRALFILGTRRVGKTFLLKRIQAQIKEEATLYFDLENGNRLALSKRGIDPVMNWFDAQSHPEVALTSSQEDNRYSFVFLGLGGHFLSAVRQVLKSRRDPGPSGQELKLAQANSLRYDPS